MPCGRAVWGPTPRRCVMEKGADVLPFASPSWGLPDPRAPRPPSWHSAIAGSSEGGLAAGVWLSGVAFGTWDGSLQEAQTPCWSHWEIQEMARRLMLGTPVWHPVTVPGTRGGPRRSWRPRSRAEVEVGVGGPASGAPGGAGSAHGLSALQPAPRRRLGQRGAATCAGSPSASSRCPAECRSPRCCPRASTGPGSPLGKTLASGPGPGDFTLSEPQRPRP